MKIADIHRVWRRMRHAIVGPIRRHLSHARASRTLAFLGDGVYRVPYTVPYYAQFASEDRLEDIIYKRLPARDDPEWKSFGAPTLEEYEFWCWRACGVVCLRMIVEAMTSVEAVLTTMDWIKLGIAKGGYVVHDETGAFVDRGWYYQPLIEVAQDMGLEGEILVHVSPLEVCRQILNGRLVIASARSSAEIGGYEGIKSQGGHLVVVTGFEWRGGKCRSVIVHNPSGAKHLRRDAMVPYSLFEQSFVGRMMVFWSPPGDIGGYSVPTEKSQE